MLQAVLDGFADDFLARLLAVALLDDAHRHAARAKALDAHLAAQFAELVLEFAVDFFARNLDRQLALEPSGIFYRDLHGDDCTCWWLFDIRRGAPASGAKGETRTRTGCPTGS